MSSIQVEIPDADLASVEDQVQREGKPLNEWLLDASHASLGDQRQVQRFESPEDIREFLQV